MDVTLQTHRRLPRLVIDGRPHPGVFCSTAPTYMRNFIDAGFDVFDTHPLTPHGWLGPDTYDYTETDRRIEAYLGQKPDALLIVRFWMEYDQARPRPGHALWWCAQHPREHVQTNRGVESGHLSAEPSFASQTWRTEAGEALRRVVAHIEERYGENVVAYVPGGGPCGEWMHWFCYGSRSGPDHLDDYSPPMRDAWHAWLAAKYGDVAALNDALGSRFTTFEDAPLPGPDARNQARHGHLRDAQHERLTIDFLDAFNGQVAQTLIHFARMTKLGCDRRKVVLAFFGYLWHHQPMVVQGRSGHLHLDDVIACPDIDGIVGPFHYSFRQVGGVVSGQGPVATTILRQKLHVHELDGSTCRKSSWPSPHHHVPRDAVETGQLMRRDLAKTITQGACAWYMDLGGGMYDDPQLIAELRQTLKLARRHALEAGANNRQVAVVLNPLEALHHREGEPLLTPLISMFKQFHLERMGLAYDDLLIGDLHRLDERQTRQYRLWIFPSLAALSQGQWEHVQRHCCRQGNHVLFNHAVGVCHGGGLNLERMRAITGLDCDATLDAGEVIVRIEPGDHPFLTGIDQPLTYGTDGDLDGRTIKHHAALNDYPDAFAVSPRFFVRQGGTILGHTVGYGQGASGGLAATDRGSWTSIWSSAPLLPAVVLRNLAAAAGCHVYSDFPGQVFHCRDYLGMYFHADGPCTLHLPDPAPAQVHDILTDQSVPVRDGRIHLSAQANTTVLYKLSPA